MKNPYDQVCHELAVILLDLSAKSRNAMQDPNHPIYEESREWKAGFDSAINIVLERFANNYLPTLDQRSNDWETIQKSNEYPKDC
jgi:hypothetical protein